MCKLKLEILGRAALLFAGVSMLGCSVALAGNTEYPFNYAFSGTAPASANQPWIGAVFEDVTPGTVRLGITNLNLSAGENVGGLYFNLNPLYSPSDLAFTLESESGGFLIPTIKLGLNQYKADGDGRYDILFSFDEGGTDTTRFTANEYLVWQITGIPSLTVADFAYLSQPAGGVGPFYAAAHVQRIAPDSLSGWIAATEIGDFTHMPEPTALSLLVGGLALMIWRGRK
jgi:hypothetical protein